MLLMKAAQLSVMQSGNNMDLQEIVNLIQVRNYVLMAVNNSAIDKKKAHALNDIQVLLDKTIIEHILDQDFKDLIGFEGVEAAVRAAALNNNIKTGMKSSKESVPAIAATAGHAIRIKPEPV
jgi:hypothetical protein